MRYSGFGQRLGHRPWLTYLFLAICTLAFVATYLYGDSTQALIALGAKHPAYMVFGGEWWRLVTAIFLHLGIEHFAFNGISFYYLGDELEPFMGRWRFFLLVMGAGIGGNLMSFGLSSSISVGASGAIFGLFASYLGLAYLYPDAYALRERAQNYAALIVVNLIISFFSTSIDLYAHLGGIIYGLGLTYVLQLPGSQRRSLWQRGLVLLAMCLLAVLFIYLGIQRTNQLYRLR